MKSADGKIYEGDTIRIAKHRGICAVEKDNLRVIVYIDSMTNKLFITTFLISLLYKPCRALLIERDQFGQDR